MSRETMPSRVWIDPDTEDVLIGIVTGDQRHRFYQAFVDARLGGLEYLRADEHDEKVKSLEAELAALVEAGDALCEAHGCLALDCRIAHTWRTAKQAALETKGG